MENWESDGMQVDILRILAEAPRCTLRRNILKQSLGTKHSYDDESLDVILARKLTKLDSDGNVKKDNRGHQNVWYFIPRKKQQSIRENLQKLLNRSVFESLTIDEQQKALSEVEYYRRREQINALLKVPLPGFTVLSEIHKHKMDCKDFHPEQWKDVDFDLKTESYKAIYQELQDNADIELKLLSEADLLNPQMREEINKLQFGWRLLGISDAGIQLYCRLQLLGQKFELQFEEEVQRWKEHFKRPDKEWTDIEAVLRKNPGTDFIKAMLGVH